MGHGYFLSNGLLPSPNEEEPFALEEETVGDRSLRCILRMALADGDLMGRNGGSGYSSSWSDSPSASSKLS